MSTEKLNHELYTIKEALRIIATDAHRKYYNTVEDILLNYIPSQQQEPVIEDVREATEIYSDKIGDYLINSVEDTKEIYKEFYKLYSTNCIKSVSHANKIIAEQIAIQYKKYE